MWGRARAPAAALGRVARTLASGQVHQTKLTVCSAKVALPPPCLPPRLALPPQLRRRETRSTRVVQREAPGSRSLHLSAAKRRKGQGEPEADAELVTRTGLEQMTDSALLAGCKVATLRGSGPGGQHRNKTESGVRITHLSTGIVGIAFEERSQHLNRGRAMKRLRAAMSLELREPVPDLAGFEAPASLRAILPGAKQRLGPNNPKWYAGAAVLLDLLAAAEGRVADAAAAASCSTAAASKLLTAPEIIQVANKIRAQHGLKPLRANK